jgi:hypothetical protein
VKHFWDFGEKFGVFGKPIYTAADLADESIMSACILHNFIKKNDTKFLLQGLLSGKMQCCPTVCRLINHLK